MRAALRGMEGMLVDFRAGHQEPAGIAKHLLEELAGDRPSSAARPISTASGPAAGGHGGAAPARRLGGERSLDSKARVVEQIRIRS